MLESKVARRAAWGRVLGTTWLSLLAACGASTSSTDSSSGGGTGTAPSAEFSAEPRNGAAPLRVTFEDLSSGDVTGWTWDFGDGSGSSAQDPEHTYTAAGEYDVRLTVLGPEGSDSLTKAGLVRVGAITAAFTADVTRGAAPLRVAFEDLSAGGVTSWAWDFGDGASASVQDPVHVYAASGSYAVSLTVSGPDGTDTLLVDDYIVVSGLQADFSAANSVGDAPLQVAFTDLSTGAVTSWSWDLGDGATSSEKNPVHTYSAVGTYSVELTVRAAGASSSLEKPGLVRVLDPDAQGVWSSARELGALPMSGASWNNLLSAANRSAGNPDVSNQDDGSDVIVLAKALVFARTGDERYRQEVVAACMAAIGTEAGGRTLALGRNLLPFVVAADLVKLSATDDARFRTWLRTCLTETLDGRTLVSTHEDRPNNWGTHAGASRIAAAVYLGDSTELARAAQVFHGWLGDRSAYSGFEYSELDWQANPSQPVGINPRGAVLNGHSVDGVLPDDQRRAGGFSWPPPKENYVWEALQGALAQAVLLHRAGYDVWSWEDQALLRAVKWLHEECDFPAGGDDTWQPHLVNYFYGADFPAPVPSSPGKNMGWTDWSHP